MEGGGWRVEDGRWRMEDGGWKMEDGRWRDGGGSYAEVSDPALAGPVFVESTSDDSSSMPHV
jgi:hypothetical protein